MAVVEAAVPTVLTGPPAAGDGSIEARAGAALLTCIARYGLAKTTLDDVAREARCSRATLYRYFDNKQALVRETVANELARVTVRAVGAGRGAADLPDAVVAVTVTVARELADHAALWFLLAHEPEVVLTHLAFAPGDRLLTEVGDALAPAFEPWLSPPDAARAGEWLARVLRSYVLMPERTVDLTREAAARAFLAQNVIPGLRSAAPAQGR
jgi:AcrR family transcriptional regulator